MTWGSAKTAGRFGGLRLLLGRSGCPGTTAAAGAATRPPASYASRTGGLAAAHRPHAQDHREDPLMNRSKASRKKNAKQAAAVVAFVGFFALSLWLGDEVWDLAAYW